MLSRTTRLTRLRRFPLIEPTLLQQRNSSTHHDDHHPLSPHDSGIINGGNERTPHILIPILTQDLMSPGVRATIYLFIFGTVLFQIDQYTAYKYHDGKYFLQRLYDWKTESIPRELYFATKEEERQKFMMHAELMKRQIVRSSYPEYICYVGDC